MLTHGRSNPSQAMSLVDPESVLKWRVRLFQDKPYIVIVIVLAAFLAGCLGIAFFHSSLMGLLGFAMILASTADYWLGANYLMDAKGIQSRIGLSLSAMEWKDVKRVVIEPSAVKLSPLAEPSKLDTFRGVILRTNPVVRTSVLDLIHARVPAETRFEETTQEFPR